MDKLTYLAKTLSRTSRKDYENFVVNAIWNQLDRDDIQPVSQQYVSNHKHGRRFIDLYFPQLNIGIECDEAHHLAQADADKNREAELVDILSAIKASDYKAMHVRICDKEGNIDYNLAIHDINTAVAALKSKVTDLENSGKLEPWNPELTAQELLQGKDTILVKDKVVFRTITEASNLLFGTNYSFQQHAYFVPRGKFQEQYSGEYVVWFPKISVDGSNTRGWKNLLKNDGTELYERNIDGRSLPNIEKEKRIIIPYVHDSVWLCHNKRLTFADK